MPDHKSQNTMRGTGRALKHCYITHRGPVGSIVGLQGCRESRSEGDENGEGGESAGFLKLEVAGDVLKPKSIGGLLESNSTGGLLESDSTGGLLDSKSIGGLLEPNLIDNSLESESTGSLLDSESIDGFLESESTGGLLDSKSIGSLLESKSIVGLLKSEIVCGPHEKDTIDTLDLNPTSPYTFSERLAIWPSSAALSVPSSASSDGFYFPPAEESLIDEVKERGYSFKESWGEQRELGFEGNWMNDFEGDWFNNFHSQETVKKTHVNTFETDKHGQNTHFTVGDSLDKQTPDKTGTNFYLGNEMSSSLIAAFVPHVYRGSCKSYKSYKSSKSVRSYKSFKESAHPCKSAFSKAVLEFFAEGRDGSLSRKCAQDTTDTPKNVPNSTTNTSDYSPNTTTDTPNNTTLNNHFHPYDGVTGEHYHNGYSDDAHFWSDGDDEGYWSDEDEEDEDTVTSRFLENLESSIREQAVEQQTEDQDEQQQDGEEEEEEEEENYQQFETESETDVLEDDHFWPDSDSEDGLEMENAQRHSLRVELVLEELQELNFRNHQDSPAVRFLSPVVSAYNSYTPEYTASFWSEDEGLQRMISSYPQHIFGESLE